MPIDYKTDGAVAIVTLNAPQALNALDPEEMFALRETLTKAQDLSLIHISEPTRPY